LTDHSSQQDWEHADAVLLSTKMFPFPADFDSMQMSMGDKAKTLLRAAVNETNKSD
jgi:hypothetical protein